MSFIVVPVSIYHLLRHLGRTSTAIAIGSFVSYYYILEAPYSVFRTLCYVEIGVLCPR